MVSAVCSKLFSTIYFRITFITQSIYMYVSKSVTEQIFKFYRISISTTVLSMSKQFLVFFLYMWQLMWYISFFYTESLAYWCSTAMSNSLNIWFEIYGHGLVWWKMHQQNQHKWKPLRMSSRILYTWISHFLSFSCNFMYEY